MKYTCKFWFSVCIHHLHQSNQALCLEGQTDLGFLLAVGTPPYSLLLLKLMARSSKHYENITNLYNIHILRLQATYVLSKKW